ncbi:MAG: glycyl-radical enzyme activating protein [Nitrospirae bacterium]|nr:glycyl-radical enzyme activating protein [Nitrospirota bacterium]
MEPVPGGEPSRADGLEAKGRIVNIQKFSIHDGPGIRTTVFLKGCPLSCLWCANPESIRAFPEVIDNTESLCNGCLRCIDVCRRRALRAGRQGGRAKGTGAGGGIVRLDRRRCDRCMACVDVCATGALRTIGETKSVREVMDVVLQDCAFYRTSGGGVTLSGGEPLVQPAFSRALLRECKARGIHTALDTSGHASRELLDRLLPFVDLVLYDIKHLDSGMHARYTGQDNAIIMENLRYLAGKVDLWIRVPVIPGFNDDPRTLARIFRLSKACRAEKLWFLPYHKWGIGKYAKLGRRYAWQRTGSVSGRTLSVIKGLAASRWSGAVELGD